MVTLTDLVYNDLSKDYWYADSSNCLSWHNTTNQMFELFICPLDLAWFYTIEVNIDVKYHWLLAYKQKV